MAVTIDKTNFTEIVDGDLPVVLDFWAPWCGPCRQIAPNIDLLATEYEGRAIVGKVDVDENNDIAMKFSVRNIPTIVFLKNGKVINKHVGAATKTELFAKMEELLK